MRLYQPGNTQPNFPHRKCHFRQYNYTTASRRGSATAAPDPYGIFGIDYEEDIYRDYWYYETKAADMNAADDVDHNAGTEWYRDAVVYPFGYGLSYGSDFAYEITGITLDKGTLEDGGSLAKVDIESSAGNEAEIKGGTVSVKVTNVGGVAGKEADKAHRLLWLLHNRENHPAMRRGRTSL